MLVFKDVDHLNINLELFFMETYGRLEARLSIAVRLDLLMWLIVMVELHARILATGVLPLLDVSQVKQYTFQIKMYTLAYCITENILHCRCYNFRMFYIYIIIYSFVTLDILLFLSSFSETEKCIKCNQGK